MCKRKSRCGYDKCCVCRCQCKHEKNDKCPCTIRVSGSSISDWRNYPFSPPVIDPLQVIPLQFPVPSLAFIQYDQVDYNIGGCMSFDAENSAIVFDQPGVYHVDYSVVGVLLDAEGNQIFTGDAAIGCSSNVYPPGQPIGVSNLVTYDVSGTLVKAAPLSPIFFGSGSSGSGCIQVREGDRLVIGIAAVGDPEQPGSTYNIMGTMRLPSHPEVPDANDISKWTYLCVTKIA